MSSLFSKSLRVHQDKLLSAWDLWPLMWGRVSGVARVKPLDFFKLKWSKILPCGGKVLHKNGGASWGA